MVAPSIVALTLAASLSFSPPPVTDDPTREDAAAAFRSGIEAFEARDFAAAADHFERAQKLAPHPATLYNLALALEQSGELIAAWDAYLEVERTGVTEADRDDAGRDRRRLEERLAVLELYAEPHTRLCLDGEPIPTTGEGRFRTATLEGDHHLVLDEYQMPITLLRGHTRVLHLQNLEQLWGKDADNPDRVTLALHATATTAGVFTLVLGSVALARRTSADPGTGVLTGAVITGSIAAIAGVAAAIQLVKTRAQRRETRTAHTGEPPTPCPPHPALARGTMSSSLLPVATPPSPD